MAGQQHLEMFTHTLKNVFWPLSGFSLRCFQCFIADYSTSLLTFSRTSSLATLFMCPGRTTPLFRFPMITSILQPPIPLRKFVTLPTIPEILPLRILNPTFQKLPQRPVEANAMISHQASIIACSSISPPIPTTTNHIETHPAYMFFLGPRMTSPFMQSRLLKK
jgi:hypothetical protein